MPTRIIKKNIHTKSHHQLQETKDQEKILKPVREKACTTYQRKTIQMPADFPSESTEARGK